MVNWKRLLRLAKKHGIEPDFAVTFWSLESLVNGMLIEGGKPFLAFIAECNAESGLPFTSEQAEAYAERINDLKELVKKRGGKLQMKSGGH